MKLTYLLKTAIIGLKTHKSRSILTVLGIIIGITAIILVMSIGQGAQEMILNQIRGLGTRTIAIEPGRQPKGPADFLESMTDSLKEKDIKALKNPANVPGLAGLAPSVALVAPISFENEIKRATVLGTGPLITQIFNIYPDQGEFFTDEQINQKSAVVIIGSEIKKTLFGESDGLGQNIKIKNKNFRVIGILAPKGFVSMYDIDNMAIVPYSTAQSYLLGISHFQSIIAQAETEVMVPQVEKAIEFTLRESHNITDPSKDDFHITSQAEAMNSVKMITTILSVLLTSIAAISLVVGGIGIMNIMLVSVLERTREIGLRKALGATENNILTQFLLEAIILTGLGGIIGVASGISYAFLASLILNKVLASGWVFAVSWQAIVLGITVSAGIGLIFGIYPAYQASKKNPVDALRYE